MPNEGGQGGNTKFIHMMKTRVQKWLPVITGLMFSMHALAYDFESGGIYYNYKEFSDSEVYVTHNGTPYSGNSYSGHVKIPKTVTYNSKMYRVPKYHSTVRHYARAQSCCRQHDQETDDYSD